MENYDRDQRVEGFNLVGSDVIDISDLLHISDNLNELLDFDTDAVDTSIGIHTDSSDVTQTIVLDGLELGSNDVNIINDMLMGTHEGSLFLGDNISVDNVTMELSIPDEQL